MGTILDRITEAQNRHDAELFASYFMDDYRSVQPVHPTRAFSGRAQVLANWSAVFAGVPDVHAQMQATCTDGDDEWGEFDWRGHHPDGSGTSVTMPGGRALVIAPP
jgi:ketosteroid isomerase-like protein